MPPPCLNQRTPTADDTPASVAAFSLDNPWAIAVQNFRFSLNPTPGLPTEPTAGRTPRLH